MFKTTAKTISTSLSLALIVGTALPTSNAFAHDRHNAAKHFGADVHLNKKRHRKFHNRFGRGMEGTRNYRSHLAPRNHVKQKRKSHNGDLIAAGIIGLAVGAIIASENAKRNQQPTYTYNDPYRSNGGYGEPIPLDEYDRIGSTGYYDNGSGEPNVITYRDTVSLEPWSRGWRNWCEQNYRSFNPARGTYRGYDGEDHFCVPK